MRSFYILFIFLFSFLAAIAEPSIDSVLQELDGFIDQKKEYLDQKYADIDELKTKLRNVNRQDDAALFDCYLDLFNEYASFIYDSAFHYAYNLQGVAFKTKNPEMIAFARMKMSFVLLSSGMFPQALDTLKAINPKIFSDSNKVEYYNNLCRAYYDMSEYANDKYFAPKYIQKGIENNKLAISYANPMEYRKWVLTALLNLRSNRMDSAIFYYRKVLHEFDISMHERAMIYASMAYTSLEDADTAQAVLYLANSAIADIKSVITETIALRNLADILYQQGDIKTAYKYILLANEDAGFYGARQRSFQISGVLPIIEGEKLGLIEKQKKQLELYLILLAILSALVLFSLTVIFKQLTGLKKAREEILVANNNLKSLNDTLKEANKIKEEYIAYYFNISTSYVDKLEHLKEAISRNLENKRYANIEQSIKKLVIKKEREQLFRNFDKIFLSVFPDFVDDFNALFADEDKVYLSEMGAMNTDLRIFALIRMGINENEKIARILNFSINTIYSYKNRIKKRALIPNNEFDERIMAIKSV